MRYLPFLALLLTTAAHAQVGGHGVGQPVFKMPLATNGILFANRSVIASTSAATVTSAGALTGTSITLTPTALSTNQAINTTQTATGTSSPPVNLNSFLINTDDMNVGTGFSVGWVFQHNFGGSAALGGREPFAVYGNLTAATSASNTNRNYVTFTSQMNAQTSDGGTSIPGDTRGAMFGFGASAVACGGVADFDNLCTGQTPAAVDLLELTGAEINIGAHTGSSISYKGGFTIAALPLDAVRGTTYDCEFCLSNQTGAVGWLDGILIGNMNGAQPIASTGTIMATVGSSTIAKGIDFSSYTFTGNEITFSNMHFDLNGGLFTGSNITVPAGNNIQWSGRGVMWSPADGVVELTNAAVTDFARLQFGGTTAAFPAIKRAGNAVILRQADDTIPTVSSLTACATGLDGGLATVSDATATTTGSVVAGGSSHHVLVYCNGTSWLVVTGT